MIFSLRFIVFLCLFVFGAASVASPPSFKIDSLNQVFGEYNNQVDLLRRDLKSEDALREASGLPPRFALPNTTFITPHSHGTWEDLDENKKVWRLKVNSKQATSINLGFTHFYLPQSAKLFMYSPDRNQVRGPFTGAKYNSLKEFWSPVILGDELVVELVVNKNEQSDVYMILGSVNHGYRGFGTKPDFERSGSCNVDVACAISEGWEDQIKSVAVISLGGSTFCTGFLVNNTSQDLRPLFMTAYHCRVRSSNAASLVSYWNYRNSSCREPDSSESGSSGDGQLEQFTSGAVYRAGGSESDFTIVEFNESIDPDFGVYYSGWDARDEDPLESTAIHHPSTDEKRISFDYDPGTTTSYLESSPQSGGTHIRVADWDVGTTEPGSSGSPLFDQNKRIVGQLHGGRAACGNDSADWYGRISYSWNAGLSEVLDPNGTGELFIDGVGSEVDYLVSASFGGFLNLGEDDFIKPGQTLNGVLVFENNGKETVSDLSIELVSDSEFVEVNLLESTAIIEPGESIELAFQAVISSEIECGSNFSIGYNYGYAGTQSLGEIESTVGANTYTSASESISVSIPDNDETGVSTQLEFSNTGESVSNLQVGINITHTYIGDLNVELVSPVGTRVTLHENAGAGDDDIVGEYPTTLSPAQSLSAFDGESLDGNWTLVVKDQQGQDRGTVNFIEIKNEGRFVCN